MTFSWLLVMSFAIGSQIFSNPRDFEYNMTWQISNKRRAISYEACHWDGLLVYCDKKTNLHLSNELVRHVKKILKQRWVDSAQSTP